MSNLNWKPFIYGGLASIVAEFGTFPIDLTKTRLQVQGQTFNAHYTEIRYKGMFHALLRIVREEGCLALYSGISPALLRQASYGTIKIGTYQTLKRLFVSRPEDETMVINVFCGVVSGVISSSIANPTDVLKIRMQAQGSLLPGSMIANFIDIYQQEGTRGLWRGVIPTAQRAAIVVGVELPVYDITKKHLILSGLMDDTILTHFIAIAGSRRLCGPVVPKDQCSIPKYQYSTPKDQCSIPKYQYSTPKDQCSIPKYQYSTPKDQCSIPKYQYSTPKDQCSIPKYQYSTPKDQCSIPKYQYSTPKDQCSIPKYQYSTPKDQCSIPKYQYSTPKDQCSIPKYQYSTPKDQCSIPKYQYSTPKDQCSIPKDQYNFPQLLYRFLQLNCLSRLTQLSHDSTDHSFLLSSLRCT
ncbi:UNVERIFIED_CONTAM: hypothetical protein FKN15_000213 [Acipenser sinensis]